MHGSGGIGARWSALVRRSALTALLGLTGPTPQRTVRRARAASSFTVPVGAENPLQFGRAYQLPPFGRGNGLDALFWVAVARLPGERADAALAALADQDVAAWTAAAPPARGTAIEDRAAPHDLWVESRHVDLAEDVLRAVLAA